MYTVFDSIFPKANTVIELVRIDDTKFMVIKKVNNKPKCLFSSISHKEALHYFERKIGVK